MNPYESPPEASVIVPPRPEVCWATFWRNVFLISLLLIPLTHGIFVWTITNKDWPNWMSGSMREGTEILAQCLFGLNSLITAAALVAGLVAAVMKRG